MKAITIRFKSGFELPIKCEKYLFRTSAVTGKLVQYEIDGIVDNVPLYLNMDEIDCIWADKEAEICQKL